MAGVCIVCNLCNAGSGVMSCVHTRHHNYSALIVTPAADQPGPTLAPRHAWMAALFIFPSHGDRVFSDILTQSPCSSTGPRRAVWVGGISSRPHRIT